MTSEASSALLERRYSGTLPLHFGVGDADGGHAVGFVGELDVLKDVGAFFLKRAKDFDGEQADFGIGADAAAQFEEVPPGAAVAGDEDFGFTGVGQDRTRRLCPARCPDE